RPRAADAAIVVGEAGKAALRQVGGKAGVEPARHRGCRVDQHGAARRAFRREHGRRQRVPVARRDGGALDQAFLRHASPRWSPVLGPAALVYKSAHGARAVAGAPGPSCSEVAMPERWAPDSWRKKPVVQIPQYPDAQALADVEKQLATF